ncbi:MAG: hypothetical protein ACREPL_00735 [Rhodanobacteraceae bacterium]
MTAPKLTGTRCQCPTCGECFNGLAGFDAHRIGPYGDDRRCLTVAEMQARGWIPNAAGFWVTDSHAQRIARRSAAGVQGARATEAMQLHRRAAGAPETRASAAP